MEALEDNLANLRVASFSYYLKPGEENSVQKINGHVDHHGPLNLSNHPGLVPSFSPHHLNDNISQENIVFRVKTPIRDINAAVLSPQTCSTQVERTSSCSNGEIGVFRADRYFKMRLDYGSTAKNGNENERPGLNPSNLRPKPPSTSSETASSCNSQAALLRNLSRKTSQRRSRRASSSTSRRIFSSFGCSGPCLDKGAVSIAENRREDSSRRLDHFAFPVLNGSEQGTTTAQVTIKSPPLVVDHDQKVLEMSRKSLDVFGSGRVRNSDVALNLARKLSVLTWDAIPKSANACTTTVVSTTICDDMNSEASSDLFEIEDFSASQGYSLLNNVEDAANYNQGNMSPPTQYAPSEASIEWSVVTASAADFSSAVSDYDEKNISFSAGDINHTNSSHRNPRTKNLEGKEVPKGRPGGLLGCKSQKAVNVAQSVAPKTRVVERY